ncbi:peptidoglycan-binding domain-containing protein [Catellatospora sp. NPDC049609]|uniref:peptidoglycan-binding domain-containing protein n=1 Tax=Catellatospora sp. NPDC049609 TaxID=3155505 RepID=UPI003418B8AE
MHNNRKLIRPVARAAVALAAILATIPVAPAVAHAATPRCDTHWLWNHTDPNGDPAVLARLGETTAFDYWVYTPAAWINSDAANPACTLSYGMTGRKVRVLQEALNLCYSNRPHPWELAAVRLGFAPLQVDGQFGPKTKAALVAAQRYHKIKTDGVYGPQTASTLRFPVQPISGPWHGWLCHLRLPN